MKTLDKEKHGKFAPKLITPYEVMHKYGLRSYKLAHLNGIHIDKPLNITHLETFNALEIV